MSATVDNVAADSVAANGAAADGVAGPAGGPEGTAGPAPVGAPATDVRPIWVAGRPEAGAAGTIEVINPYDGSLVARVGVPSAEQVDRAVAAAAGAARQLTALPAHARAAALDHVSAELTRRAGEIAEVVTAENGKPIKWARVEVTRAASVFRWAAEETRRWAGDMQRLDTDPGGTGRLALVRRFPKGPVLGIAPFNFPLNLVAHKVAPALAIGAPIIIKPAPATPLSALALGEILAETDLPAGSFSVLPVPNEAMGDLVADPRLPVISFTGSGPVGASIRAAVPGKHVTLELGGNAAVLVCADWNSETDLAWAANRIATFANYQAGQSCISVQRVYVDRSIAAGFTDRLVGAVAGQGCGDPRDVATDVGPLVNEAAAARVESWVAEAVAAGGVLRTGGQRDGCSLAPAVLTGVPADAKVVREEVFGPVLVVEPVDGLDDGFARINDSRYGLQAGVFTHDIATAFRAHQELEVGGVIIGDVPSYRADQMPYGGTKESGAGREGVHAAMEDLSYERVMVLTGLAL